MVVANLSNKQLGLCSLENTALKQTKAENLILATYSLQNFAALSHSTTLENSILRSHTQTNLRRSPVNAGKKTASNKSVGDWKHDHDAVKNTILEKLKNNFSTAKTSADLSNKLIISYNSHSIKTSGSGSLKNRLLTPVSLTSSANSRSPHLHTENYLLHLKSGSQPSVSNELYISHIKNDPSNSTVVVEPVNSDDFKQMELPHENKFPTSKEMEIKHILHSPQHNTKAYLLDCVCTSLINNPNWFSSSDKTRQTLYALCTKIAQTDPEFVLKVALYTRVELNVRATCNFLLCVASSLLPCRPYLKKYFKMCIKLPSDWIQVTEFYHSLCLDGNIANNLKLPSSLRKVMVSKFPDFDEYQLAKYNKDKSKSVKKKEKRIVKKSKDEAKEQNNEDNDGPYAAKSIVPSYTLKFLTRKLHIKNPAYLVMCLLGKKYPDNMDSFYAAGLEGTWDSKQAGRRMKLEVPETWETQLSAKGNKAKTWEDLLEHKKLPFMAMLRNIRNMIKAGIGEKYHAKVISTLKNERAVTKSKQFPFRFFSAYQALDELQNDIVKREQYKKDGCAPFIRKNQKNAWGVLKKAKFGSHPIITEEDKALRSLKKKLFKKYNNTFAYDENLIRRYRSALNEAVRIATVNNVPPIEGLTVVVCDVRKRNMKKTCSSAKGIGSVRTLLDVGVLLGLMCAYSCEAITFLICSSSKSYKVVELEKGGILENLSSILEMANLLPDSLSEDGFVPMKYLTELLLTRSKFDNLLLLSAGLESTEDQKVSVFLERYRECINANVKCYDIDLAGKRSAIRIDGDNENIMRLSGFSDQILRHIALRGGDDQVLAVDNIDRKYNLKSSDEFGTVTVSASPLITCLPKPKPWKTVRVFISSTFKDMQSERDALVHFVFPTLRERAKKLNIHIVEIDLRWGIPSEDKYYQSNLSMCLHEVEKSDIFFGILGDRYGWIPADYGFNEPGWEWLETYPSGRSITELEIHQAAFMKSCQQKVCLFFLRDSTKLKETVPKEMRKIFFECNAKNLGKLVYLKDKIRSSDHAVFDDYQAEWEGCADGRLKLKNLEQFREAALNMLWNAVIKLQHQETTGTTLSNNETDDEHVRLVSENCGKFAGRSALVASLCSKILSVDKRDEGNIIALVGKVGSGTSTTMAKLHEVMSSDGNVVCAHFTSPLIPHSRSVVRILYRFCDFIIKIYEIAHFVICEDYRSLVSLLPKLIEEVVKKIGRMPNIVLLIDKLDEIQDELSYDFSWLSKIVLKGVTVAVTCLASGSFHRALKCMQRVTFHSMTDLGTQDKRTVIRSMLGAHGKKLDESSFNNQMRLFISKQDSTIPLYLSVVCEIIRLHETFESLTNTLKALPHDLKGVLKWQLEVVQSRFQDYHGIVSYFLSLVYCSMKWKISEQELYHALCLRYSKMNGNTSHPIKCIDDVQMLPSAVFISLSTALKTFLAPSVSANGVELSLSHEVHRKVVQERTVREELWNSCHSTLVDLFTLKLRESYSGECKDSYVAARSLSRLPYHLMESNQANILMQLLTDFTYVYLVCKLGHGSELLHYYDLLENNQDKQHSKGRGPRNKILLPWQEMKKFLSSCIHIVVHFPEMLFQFALNQPEESYPSIVCKEVLFGSAEKIEKFSFLEHVNRSDIANLCKHTLSDSRWDEPNTITVNYQKSLLAWGSKSGKVSVMGNNRDINTWFGHRDKVTAVCLTSASTMVSASADGMVKMWNFVDGYSTKCFVAHSRKITALAIKPLSQGTAGRIFVTASHDRTIGIWNMQGNPFTSKIKTDGSPANCIAFHPHHPRVVVGLWDSSLRIWDIQTCRRIAVIRGHQRAISSVQYSVCGTYIASCSVFESFIRLWASGAGVPLGNFSETLLSTPRYLTFSPDGNYIFGAGDGTDINCSQIVAWNSHLGLKESTYIPQEPAKCGSAKCCNYDEHNSFLGVGYHGGQLAIFDIKIPIPIYIQKIHEAAITCISWVHPKKRGILDFLFDLDENAVNVVILTGSVDHSVKAVYPDTKTVIATLTGHTAPVLCVAYNDSWVAAGSESFDVLLWRFKLIHGSEHHFVTNHLSLQCHDGPVSCLSFNYSGSMLVSGGRDGKLAFWDVSNTDVMQLQEHPKPFASIDHAHKDWITCCSWNDKSDHIVTGSNDTNLKLWACPEFSSNREKEYKIPLVTLKGHESGVTSVCYRSGTIASTGGEDCSIRIWSHKGIEITSIRTESRANFCDITFSSESSNSLEFDIADGVDKESLWVDDMGEAMDWADQVDLEEWEEDHKQKKPGAKKKKCVTVEMQNLQIACASIDSTVSVWKPLVGNRVAILSGHSKLIHQVTSYGKNTASSCSADGTIKIWKLSSSEETSRHVGEVTCMVTSEDFVASGCNAGFLYLWSWSNDSGDIDLLYKVKAHSRSVTGLSEVKDARFISISLDCSIQVWGIVSLQESLTVLRRISILQNNVPLLVISGNPEKFWISSIDNYCKKYSFTCATKQIVAIGDMKCALPVQRIKFVSDRNNQILFFRDKGEVIDHPEWSIYMENGEFLQSAVFVRNLFGTEDLTYVAGDTSGNLHIPKLKKKIKVHDSRITAIIDNDDVMITASSDCMVKVWKKMSMQQTGQFFATSPISSAVLSACKSFLLTGDCSGVLSVIKIYA